MIERYMYMGYFEEAFKINKICDAENLSVFTFRNMIFIYFEAENKDINPNEIISETIPFPNGDKLVRMMNIFCYSKPISREYWKRKVTPKQTQLRIEFLKPEKVSEYIFYHYKFQEEKHERYDKFGSIFIFTNMIVMYNEYPEELAEVEIENTLPMGCLCNCTIDNYKCADNEYAVTYSDGTLLTLNKGCIEIKNNDRYLTKDGNTLVDGYKDGEYIGYTKNGVFKMKKYFDGKIKEIREICCDGKELTYETENDFICINTKEDTAFIITAE